MTEAWIVTKGEYSDYSVMCVCDTKERAEQIVALYNGDSAFSYGDARVEAVIYLDREPKKLTTYFRQVQVWDDGHTDAERENQNVEWEFDLLWPERAKPVTWRWVRAPMHNNKGGRLEVAGTSAKRVAKVFSEKRAQLLADDAMRMRQEIRG
jgi:hypothetical protein